MSERRIRLSDAQFSAIVECRTDEGEQVDGLVVDGRHLVVDDPASTFTVLMGASNAEWEFGEAHDCKYARRAARSLDCVAFKVARLTA